MPKPRWKFAILSAVLLLILSMQAVLADFNYTVQPGDTLSKLSRQYNTTISAILAVNNIANPNLIYVGQTLVIPDGSSAPAPTSPPPLNPPSLPQPTAVPPSSAGSTYVVQRGDTLYRISQRFGVTVQAIAAANNIQNLNYIYVGQVLTIPGTAVPPPAPPPIQPTQPAPNPTAPPPPPTSPPPPPPSGVNTLTNGSFEGSWYHPSGIPELQIPAGWIFEWDTGPTGFGSQPWDVWVRPEVRVLPAYQLPAHEQGLFIFDGNQTVKAFKGSGAISYRLYQQVTLQPGTYRLVTGVFPDLVTGYVNGQKVWPTDPSAGEVRFIVGNGGSGWFSPAFGQKNELSHTFAVNTPQTIRIGMAIRGRYALQNNGWFVDDWSLIRIQ